jgi:membrane protein insertase Oxa1/YidC/SpoIIIJ
MASLGNSIKILNLLLKIVLLLLMELLLLKNMKKITTAAAQMESLNSLYKIQLQSASRNAQINEEVAENNIN